MAGELVAPALLADRCQRRWLIALVVLATYDVACTPKTKLNTADGDEQVTGYRRVGKTQGSAVAVTQSEKVAVVTNRTDGVVSVLRLDRSGDLRNLVLANPHTEFSFRPLNESKPWAVVIGADDDTAYVLLRGPGEVARISRLHSASPQLMLPNIKVGSEPTSIVISPSGKSLYVSNWGDGSVTSIVIKPWLPAAWDLNRRLADTSLLGPLITGGGEVASAVWTRTDLELRRPGLAHPRALAITDNGDERDEDEMLYATEFFSQPLANGGPGGVDDVDHSREGLVYPILVGEGAGNAPRDAEGNAVNVIELAPVDTGFNDAEGVPTACFPNQLYAAATSGDRLFVTSVCASPLGPLEAGPPGELQPNNFKTILHSAVFAIDTNTNRAVAEEALVLTSSLDRAYAGDAMSPEHRMPLIPNDIVVAPPADDGTRQGFISAFGSSAVYPVLFAADGGATFGSDGHRFIDLGAGLPVGLALLSNGRALVADDLKPALFVTELAAGSKVSRDTLTQESVAPDEVVSDDVREGRRLFSTGLKAWSLNGQAWTSCESCHPEGLNDGVTWRFTRGPRRTISLAGTYYRDEPTQRMLLWTANADEVHDVEIIARALSGGVGGVIWNGYAADSPSKDCRLLYDGKPAGAVDKNTFCSAPLSTTNRANGLNGSLASLTRDSTQEQCLAEDGACNINASRDWDHIDAFIRTVRAPHAPTNLDPGRVTAGKQLFKGRRCAACHGGPGWTLSKVFYEPGVDANGQVPFADPRTAVPPVVPDASAIASMLGTLRTTSYTVDAKAPAAFWPAPGVDTGWFRAAPSSTATPDELLDYAFGGGKSNPAPDQIRCVLRQVGTFPSQVRAADLVGVTPDGAPPVHEVRHILNATTNLYEDKIAVGATGFNTPSLVGLAAGAPYFHAGNARTLEELFDVDFVGHYGVFDQSPLVADDIQNLVSYLLSIDETDASTPVTLQPGELEFDPDLCAKFSR